MDGEDSFVNAALGLGVVSLKTSGAGHNGWQGGSMFEVLRV